MNLTVNEESLIRVLRSLPPDETGKVLLWAQHLSELGAGQGIEWSDSWSEEDVREATQVSLQRFEKQERDEH